MIDYDRSELLSSLERRAALAPKAHCYNLRLRNGQYLGYRRHQRGGGSWIASYRRKVGGRRDKFLGWADDENIPARRKSTMAFAEALRLAEKWFQTMEVVADRVDGYPLGRFNTLCACPVGNTYTVLSAVADYIEYRKQFRAPTNHIPIVYMANAYIVPLIGNIPVDELTLAQARSVALEVEATDLTCIF